MVSCDWEDGRDAEIAIPRGSKRGLLYRIFYRARIEEVGSLYAGNVPEIKL